MAEDQSHFKQLIQRLSVLSGDSGGNRYIGGRRRNRIPSETLSAYTAYLDDPHSNGYWRLTAKWLTDGQVQKFLIKSLIKDNDSTKLKKLGSLTKEERLNLLASVFDEQHSKSERIRELNSNISIILELFEYCIRDKLKDDNQIELQPITLPNELETISPKDVLDNFQEAFRIFSENIWFEGHEPRIFGDNPYFLNTGAVFVTVGPREGRGRIEIASPDKSSLESFVSFLRACGAIAEQTVERVFAPEEVLLAPYFAYLRSTFEEIVDDERIRPQLQQAFDYYKKDDFQHCISTLGIIAEDYITQIYSTFFREPCQVGWTLGQIYDQCHNRLKELLEAPKQEPLSLDDLYDLAKKTQALDKNVESGAVADVIRRIANVIKRDRAVFQERIEQLKSKPRNRSIFPKYLQNNIEELIRNRNAASHKTRVPLGNYEAQKTLQSLVSIIFWWSQLKKKIPWTQSKMEIIEFVITLAVEDKRK